MHTRTRSLPESEWLQLRSAYIAGAGLRALAREAGLPEGSVLARAHREGWSAAKRQGQAVAKATQAKPKVKAAQAVANEAGTRGELHVKRMERLCEVVGGHAESLPPSRLFESINRLDALDRVARRTYGLDSGNGAPIQILMGAQTDLPRARSQVVEAEIVDSDDVSEDEWDG